MELEGQCPSIERPHQSTIARLGLLPLDSPMRTTLLQEISERYGHRIFGFCLKRVINYHDAQDIYQEVLLALNNSAHTFREGSEGAWIMAICDYKIIDYFKWKNRKFRKSVKVCDPSQLGDHPEKIQDSEAIVLLGERREMLRESMSKLQPLDRILLELVMQGVRIEAIRKKPEIVALRGLLPYGTVSRRIYLARGKIRKMIFGS